jgi:hypothetical protein
MANPQIGYMFVCSFVCSHLSCIHAIFCHTYVTMHYSLLHVAASFWRLLGQATVSQVLYCLDGEKLKDSQIAMLLQVYSCYNWKNGTVQAYRHVTRARQDTLFYCGTLVYTYMYVFLQAPITSHHTCNTPVDSQFSARDEYNTSTRNSLEDNCSFTAMTKNIMRHICDFSYLNIACMNIAEISYNYTTHYVRTSCEQPTS